MSFPFISFPMIFFAFLSLTFLFFHFPFLSCPIMSFPFLFLFYFYFLSRSVLPCKFFSFSFFFTSSPSLFCPFPISFYSSLPLTVNRQHLSHPSFTHTFTTIKAASQRAQEFYFSLKCRGIGVSPRCGLHTYTGYTLYIFPYISFLLQVPLTHAVILCRPEGLAVLLTYIQQATFTNNTRCLASGDTGTWRALHSYSN